MASIKDNSVAPAGRVMGFGTFDGLHPGHLSYLNQLRTLGKEVWVVVARDKTVEKTKGRKPVFNETERLEAVQKTGLADHPMLGSETNLYQCLIDYQPEVLGLGYDQKANLEYLAEHFPEIRIVRLQALKPHIFKSSLLTKELNGQN